MTQILLVVLAIALAASALAGGVWHVSSDAGPRELVARSGEAGFRSLAAAHAAHLASTGLRPPPSAWEAALFPAYGFKPAPPQGMSWTYGGSGSAAWFCLTDPSATAARWDGLDRIGRRFGADLYVLAASCGAASAAARPASFPAPAAATYVVAR